jgi:hypothetical protein
MGMCLWLMGGIWGIGSLLARFCCSWEGKARIQLYICDLDMLGSAVQVSRNQTIIIVRSSDMVQSLANQDKDAVVICGPDLEVFDKERTSYQKR